MDVKLTLDKRILKKKTAPTSLKKAKKVFKSIRNTVIKPFVTRLFCNCHQEIFLR